MAEDDPFKEHQNKSKKIVFDNHHPLPVCLKLKLIFDPVNP